MKTLEDYHHQILGLSLNLLKKRPKPLIKKENIKTPLNNTENNAEKIYFITDPDDLNKNRDLVVKVLKSINKDKSILKRPKDIPNLTGTVFYFGSALKTSITEAKVLNWPSFSEISKDVDLKRQLWSALKKES